MPVTIQCPNLTCRAVLRVPEKTRGKKIRCGKCGLTFVVPTPALDRKTNPANTPKQ